MACGYVSGLPVYEAQDLPGGICCSYYSRKDGTIQGESPRNGEAYRFEIGGGHWIFGGDTAILQFIRSLTPFRSYQRRASVFLSKRELLIPYPLQNHLRYLGKDVAAKVIQELSHARGERPVTMADAVRQSFGPTLTDLFFRPFHERYTADLWTRIAPQDDYKSPVDMSHILNGASRPIPAVGYNKSFLYPQQGLDALARKIAAPAKINYGKRAVHVDLTGKSVTFAEGSVLPYDVLVSTLPLNKMMAMSGSSVDAEPDPYTSVLVLNIGALRGKKCPPDHWLYVPDSDAGFYRVGFYSNVDPCFLPKTSRKRHDRVSIYVERAYLGGHKPSAQEMADYSAAVVRELQAWGFIKKPEVVHPTWIEVAYTWAWPGSQWRDAALRHLEQNHVRMVGRYARWTFQGIADSIRDGLRAAAGLGAGTAGVAGESLALPHDVSL